MKNSTVIKTEESIKNKIFTIRNTQVIIDTDLASFYEIDLKRLNEQVRRNINRFPDTFMFQLTNDEYNYVRSQFATLETGRGTHRKYLPFVFTEQGVAMVSGILKSSKAVEININILSSYHFHLLPKSSQTI